MLSQEKALLGREWIVLKNGARVVQTSREPLPQQQTIGETRPVQGFQVDEDIGQGGEMLDGALVAHFGMGQTKLLFAVAVDTLARGALAIDGGILGAVAVE